MSSSCFNSVSDTRLGRGLPYSSGQISHGLIYESLLYDAQNLILPSIADLNVSLGQFGAREETLVLVELLDNHPRASAHRQILVCIPPPTVIVVQR